MDVEERYNNLYKKLKQSIYYEPELYQQRHLAEYETKIKQNPSHKNDVYRILKYFLNWETRRRTEITFVEDFIDDLIGKISYHIQPKKVSLKNPEEKASEKKKNKDTDGDETKTKPIFSNITGSECYEWEDINYVFDIPIPLLLLDVWWCCECGSVLDAALDNQCYGNRIHPRVLQSDGGSHLFKKYIDQYNTWRAKAVEKSEEVLHQKKGVGLFSLDISKCYYSIDINFEEVRQELRESKIETFRKETPIFNREIYSDTASKNSSGDSELTLTRVIEKIHRKCTELISEHARKTHGNIFGENFGEPEGQQKILPIGLFSSKILSNWYLREFDKKIIQELNPEYYGRYVDDILLVQSVPKPDEKASWKEKELRQAMEETFVKKGILQYHEEIEEEKQNHSLSEYEGSGISNGDEENNNKKIKKWYYSIVAENVPLKRLRINQEKIKLFQIHPEYSDAVFRLLKMSILNQKKAFSYLPEEPIDRISADDLYQLIFSENGVGKIRNIERTALNPIALSTLLAKEAYHLRICGKPLYTEKKFINSLLKDLKGLEYLEYSRTWDKVFTLFVLTKDIELFNTTYADIYQSISHLKLSSKLEISEFLEGKTVADMHVQLNLSCGIALSLLSKENREIFKLKEEKFSDSWKEILSAAEVFRASQMFRHHHVAYPLINYITGYEGDLCSIDVFGDEFNTEIKKLQQKNKTQENHLDAAPILRLDEEQMNFSPRFIHSHELQLFYVLKYLKEVGCLFREDDKERLGYLKDAIDNHNEIYKWIKEKIDKIPPILVLNHNNAENTPHIRKIKVQNSFEEKQDDKRKIQNIKVGIANLQIAEETIMDNLEYFRTQNTSLERWLDLAKILNISITEKCDMVVFPELSIPARWIVPLTFWAQDHQIGLVFGIEYILSDEKAYNFTAAILPYQVSQHYQSCCVSLRLKNYYAPGEIKDLNVNRYEVPEESQHSYNLYEWKGNQFTIYNCFELADIKHRSLFVSELDYLIACSWNKDVDYYANILESMCRDVHCYVMHANTANYGESRILQPTKRELKTLAAIGGGKNATLMVGELDIQKLAEFQVKAYNSDDETFKPLPPGFDSEMVKKRHKLG